MRLMKGMFALLFVSTAVAQPPERSRADDAASFVARLMAFDKNQDGKLARDELTDERLHRLFDRADTNKDGSVTKEELTALFEREGQASGGGRGMPQGPAGGPGGPGGRGPGGPLRPGQVLPEVLLDDLDLSFEQKRMVAELQKEVDARLDKILSEEQKAKVKEMRERRPGRPE